MGYEITLIIGEKKQDHFSEIGRIDLSKIGDGPLAKLIVFGQGKSSTINFEDFRFLKNVKGQHLGIDPSVSNLFDLGMDYDKVKVYWESNERVGEDLYGDPLPAIPLHHIIAAINEELKSSSYRRFKMAKSVLSCFSNSDWSDIYIVPFGH